MSFVRKLEIQGIRSVGPNDSEKVTLKFDRPFTIITGFFDTYSPSSKIGTFCVCSKLENVSIFGEGLYPVSDFNGS